MAIKKGHKKRGPIFIEKHPSQNNDNYGHVNAKWIKHFKDEITREIFTLTDLQEKKHAITKVGGIYRALRSFML